MGFYFCGKHIYTNYDDKEVEQSMFAVVRTFEVPMTIMVMKIRKAILKLSSTILF